MNAVVFAALWSLTAYNVYKNDLGRQRGRDAGYRMVRQERAQPTSAYMHRKRLRKKTQILRLKGGSHEICTFRLVNLC